MKSKDNFSYKVAFPFKIEIDSMERLIVCSLKDDPEFSMIEPQVFNDPINGKGMRIILYRKDQKVDIYWQPGVIIDRDTITIGAGIGHFKETNIQPSRFEITDKGVDLDVEFMDAQGRTVKLKITENATGIKPFPFLAPVGKDIDNPKRLFLAHMLEFDFVHKTGTVFSCKIGDRSIKPESFPILRNFKKVMFIRYSGFPVVGTLNPSMAEPVTFEVETPGNTEVDGMSVHVDSDHRIKQVSVTREKKKVELVFPDGFPNLYDVKDGSEEKGEWQYLIAGMTITGGTYYLARSGSDIEIEMDVNQNWRPNNLPFSFKLFTLISKSFRNWPKTYKWIGLINLESNSLAGSWNRKK